jgi:cation diffusion facilitator family transporter
MSTEERAKYGKLAGLIGIVCNFLSGIGMIVFGTLSGSVAMITEGIHNLTDVFSGAAIFTGFKLTELKAHDIHPHGHAKHENIAGYTVALFMLFAGIFAIHEAISRILEPEDLSLTPILFATLAFSIVSQLIQTISYHYFAKKINSNALKTAGLETRNDVLGVAMIFIAMIFMSWTGINIDGWLAIAIALLMIYDGVKMAKEEVMVLVK